MTLDAIDTITGATLKDIRGVLDDNEYGGEEYLEIAFHIGDSLLRLVPLPETDEIHAEVVPAGGGQDLSPLAEGHWMNEYIGQSLSLAWTCTNSRGYDDLVVLAFGLHTPDLGIVCECSTLRLLKMTRQ